MVVDLALLIITLSSTNENLQEANHLFKNFFYFFFFLSRLHTQRGAQTHDPKNHMLYRLNQPSVPIQQFLCVLPTRHFAGCFITLSTQHTQRSIPIYR